MYCSPLPSLARKSPISCKRNSCKQILDVHPFFVEKSTTYLTLSILSKIFPPNDSHTDTVPPVDQSIAKRKLPASDSLTRGQRQKAREEQEDTRRGRRTEPATLYPQRTPDSRRLTQAKHERTRQCFQCDLAVTGKVTCQTQGRACEYLGRGADEQ